MTTNIKSIEVRGRINLRLLEKNNWYFIEQNGKIVCTTKGLDAALHYFEIAYNDFCLKNN